jgi:hypothetical protein
VLAAHGEAASCDGASACTHAFIAGEILNLIERDFEAVPTLSEVRSMLTHSNSLPVPSILRSFVPDWVRGRVSGASAVLLVEKVGAQHNFGTTTVTLRFRALLVDDLV